MTLRIYLSLCAAAALIFLLVPEIDIGFSRLFYGEYGRFFPKNTPVIYSFYTLVPKITFFTMGLVLVLIVVRFIPSLKAFHARKAVIAYIALSLLIGPLLISNMTLKENMGRARPNQTVEFGGVKQFTPALVPSDQCPKNCSFVSGHASTAFFIVTFAFLLAPGFWRSLAIGAAIAFGSAAGLGRVAQGAHFLSDVTFAGLINFGVAWGLYHLLIGRAGAPIRARWGERLGAWSDSLFGQHGQSQFDARAKPNWRTHAGVFAAVAAITAHSYLFFDKFFAGTFADAANNIQAFFSTVALAGDSGFWLIASASAFVALWAASRHPRLTEARDRLAAWAMLPLFMLTSVAVSRIAAGLLELAFGRAAPLHLARFNEYGFYWFEFDPTFRSFPSSHAVTAVTVATALYFIVPRWRPALIAGAVIVAPATAISLQHFTADILFGAYLALMTTAWVRTVFLRSGIGLTLSTLGIAAPGPKLPWTGRLGIPVHRLRSFLEGALSKWRSPPRGSR